MHPNKRTLKLTEKNRKRIEADRGLWQIWSVQDCTWDGLGAQYLWGSDTVGSKAHVAKRLWACAGNPCWEWGQQVNGVWLSPGVAEQWWVLGPDAEPILEIRKLLEYGQQLWHQVGWVWPWERHIEWITRSENRGYRGVGPVPGTGGRRGWRYKKSSWPGASIPLAAQALAEAEALLDATEGPPPWWGFKTVHGLRGFAKGQLDASVRDWDDIGQGRLASACWKDQHVWLHQWGGKPHSERWTMQGGLRESRQVR
jgi:hypothetical protein